jgi:hypothetical protein
MNLADFSKIGYNQKTRQVPGNMHQINTDNCGDIYHVQTRKDQAEVMHMEMICLHSITAGA